MQEMGVLLQDNDLDESTSSETTSERSTETHNFRNWEHMDLGEYFSTSATRLRPALRVLRQRISRHSHNLPADVPSTISFLARSTASCAISLLSIVTPRYMHKGGLQPLKKLGPTSYLDALRGLAALVVLNHHFFPYTDAWIMSQPFFRLFLSGRGMVDIFFVISGYVLGYRLLQLMRAKQDGPLLNAFVSSFFRRYIRLYGSAAAATFATMLLARYSLTPIRRFPTFMEQLMDWADDVGHFSNPFVDLPGFWTEDVFGSRYLVPLWTIPIEFRGSMFLYVFCIATCKLSVRGRMLLCGFIIFLCYYWAAIYGALFLQGLFLAEMSFIRHPERVNPSQAPPLPSNSSEQASSPRGQSLRKRLFYASAVIISLFLVSQPSTNLQDAFWPWPYLDHVIPGKYRGSGVAEHFWLSIGSVMLIWALDCCPTLQTCLRWNFSQYLGDLSFGIYVMHIVVVWSLWIHVLDPWRLSLLGDQKWTFVPFLILNYAGVLWAADLFSKVDKQVVSFGRWLQIKTFDW